MAKLYFIDDENGTYISEDGKRRFSMIPGTEIEEFFKTPRGNGVRFFEQEPENGIGDTLCVEIPKDQLKSFRIDERRRQYVRDCQKESGLQILSYDALLTGDGEAEALKIFSSLSYDPDAVNKNKQLIKDLYAAVDALSPEEKDLITALFLLENRYTETAYAEK